MLLFYSFIYPPFLLLIFFLTYFFQSPCFTPSCSGEVLFLICHPLLQLSSSIILYKFIEQPIKKLISNIQIFRFQRFCYLSRARRDYIIGQVPSFVGIICQWGPRAGSRILIAGIHSASHDRPNSCVALRKDITNSVPINRINITFIADPNSSGDKHLADKVLTDTFYRLF